MPPARDPADHPFTEHLRTLAAGRQPDAGEVRRVLARLERLVRREVRRRGLGGLPPERLGLIGFRTWRDEGVWEELAVDAYEEAILRRLRGLLARLATREHVEALVATNVKWFLRDLQRRGDPLGYRAWEVAYSAAERAVERGALVVVAGGPPLDADTLLAPGHPLAARFGAARIAAAAGGDFEDAPDEERDDAGAAVEEASGEPRLRRLAGCAARWNGELLPELVTAGPRGLDAVIDRLAARLPELDAAGVESFRLRELVAALRDDLRPRWLARLRESGDEVAAGEVRSAGEDDPPLPVVRLTARAPDPESTAAGREAARRLLRCVEDGLEALPADERTRQEAHAVWRARVAAAAEGAAAPSGRELARALRIPRHRLPPLVEAVHEVTERCRRELGLAGADEEGR